MKVLLSVYAGEAGNRDAVLRVFGDGPDMSRVRRAAQRCGRVVERARALP
jgi:hypothetical protein